MPKRTGTNHTYNKLESYGNNSTQKLFKFILDKRKNCDFHECLFFIQ